MMFGDGFYGIGHGFGGIIMIIFWVIVIYLVFRGSRDWTSTRSESWHSAEDILKERYVKGDINKEEFEKMRKDLRH